MPDSATNIVATRGNPFKGIETARQCWTKYWTNHALSMVLRTSLLLIHTGITRVIKQASKIAADNQGKSQPRNEDGDQPRLSNGG